MTEDESEYYGTSICANCGDNIPCRCRKPGWLAERDECKKKINVVMKYCSLGATATFGNYMWNFVKTVFDINADDARQMCHDYGYNPETGVKERDEMSITKCNYLKLKNKNAPDDS